MADTPNDELLDTWYLRDRYCDWCNESATLLVVYRGADQWCACDEHAQELLKILAETSIVP